MRTTEHAVAELQKPFGLAEIRGLDFPPIRKILTPHQKRLLQLIWRQETSSQIQMQTVGAMRNLYVARVTRDSLLRKELAFSGAPDLRVSPIQHSLGWRSLCLTRLGMLAAARLRYETLLKRAKREEKTPAWAARKIAKEARYFFSRDEVIRGLRAAQDELTDRSEAAGAEALEILREITPEAALARAEKTWAHQIERARTSPTGEPREIGLSAVISLESLLKLEGAGS